MQRDALLRELEQLRRQAAQNEASLRAIFGTKAAFQVRESSKGNYRAVTVDEKVAGPDDIFARYEAASKIPGIFSL